MHTSSTSTNTDKVKREKILCAMIAMHFYYRCFDRHKYVLSLTTIRHFHQCKPSSLGSSLLINNVASAHIVLVIVDLFESLFERYLGACAC